MNRVDAINQLTEGFMVPVEGMKRTDPHTGRTLYGLLEPDIQRIVDGYGCPECLAKFKTYLPVCPVCDHQRDIDLDMQKMPTTWLESHREWHQGETEGSRARSIDEFIRDVRADPDVDQIKL